MGEKKNTYHADGKPVLPKETQLFLDGMAEKREWLLELNPYLSLNRICCEYPPERENKEKKYEPLLLKRVKEGPVEDVRFCNGRLKGILDMINRRNAGLAGLFPSEMYPFTPGGRLTAGEGNSVYLGVQPLKLDSLYGLPCLPASTIKGTLRNVWVNEEYSGDTAKSEGDKEFIALFGGKYQDSSRQEGNLIFFDTYPKTFSVELDVQTPHYVNYYKGIGQPTDDQNPKPAFFMCLGKASFRIPIACRDEKLWERNKEKIDRMVEVMLTVYGLGAKTALGYGVE